MLNLPFEKLYSIELDLGYFQKAVNRFLDELRVIIFWGDSREELPRLLSQLHNEREPVLFWLDAHGTNGDPNNYEGAILEELKEIFAWNGKGVVLVDDIEFLPDVLPNLEGWKQPLDEKGIAAYIHVD